jgi:hypothetical protein
MRDESDREIESFIALVSIPVRFVFLSSLRTLFEIPENHASYGAAASTTAASMQHNGRCHARVREGVIHDLQLLTANRNSFASFPIHP